MNLSRFHPYRVRYPYQDPVERHRARAVLLVGLGFLFLISIVFTLMVATGRLPTISLAVFLGVTGLVAMNIVFVQTGRLQLAGLIIMGLLLAAAISGVLFEGIGLGVVFMTTISIMTAAALYGRTGAILMTGLDIALIGVAGVLQAQGVTWYIEQMPTIVSPIIGISSLIAVMLLQMLFSGSLERTLRRSVHTTSRLAATTEVSEILMVPRTLESLLRQTVALIREKFGFYHVQVFLLDEDGGYAVLKASTGRAGRRLLAAEHRLGVGSQSVVGRAAALNEPVLAQHIDVIYHANPLLPDTRTELALPLQSSEGVVGVLDVQSTEENAFEEEDITGLQALANQLAVTIDRVRLLEVTRRRLEENEHLLAENRARLAEVERLNRQLTGRAWQEYLHGRGTDTAGFDWEQGDLEIERAWTPGLISAMGLEGASLRQEEDRQVLALPIVLRDTPLGAIELSGSGVNWDQDTQELAQEVVNRLAVALDSARLFENSQRLAERERLVNEVAARLQGASDMTDMLSLAAQEIRQALGAHMVSVRLSNADVQSATDNGRK